MKKIILLSLTFFSALQSSPWEFIKNRENEHIVLNQRDIFATMAALSLGMSLYKTKENIETAYKWHRTINTPTPPNGGDIDINQRKITARNFAIFKSCMWSCLSSFLIFSIYKAKKS